MARREHAVGRRFDAVAAVAVAALVAAVPLAIAASLAQETLEIFEIQGPGMSSPVQGAAVRTEGNVVTAVGRDGFFIQTPDARDDGNPATSNGLYVVTEVSPEVAVGQRIDVVGTVVELFGWTQLHESDVVGRGSGSPLPAPVDLDRRTPSPNQPWPAVELERFEGMRLRIAAGTVAGPGDGFGDAAVVAKPERPFREPGILYPGLAGLPVFDGNPETFWIAPGGLTGQGELLAGGSSFAAVGVLAEEFDEYRLWPTQLELTEAPSLPRPVRPRRSGELTVATQNLERLDRAATDPPYATRLAKLSRQIRSVLRAPEVVAVQEVQDLATLSDLASRIRSDDPAIVYAARHQEAPAADELDVGFLVRDTVDVLSVTQIGANVIFSLDGSLLNDRPPLVLEAVWRGHDPPLPLTVVAVHQRSLIGIDDPEDGERVRRKRHEQAVWLAGWVQQRQTERPDERLIVIGDFNAFEFTDGYVDVMGQVTGAPDPRGALIPTVPSVDPPLTDWAGALPAAERYSYVWDGDAELLDHVLTSQAASPWVATVAASRGNADAPQALDDDPSTAARSSDHDGLVLYLGPHVRRPEGRLPLP
jgi:predicted extracellular nuclease